MHIRNLLIIFFMLACASAQAAGLDKTRDAKKLVEDVMALIAAGNMSRALRALKPYSTVPELEFESLAEQIQEQIPLLEERFGRTTGVEFLNDKEEGDSLYLVEYLQKFQRHAVLWQFIFYKPDREWVLSSFASDSNLSVLFR